MNNNFFKVKSLYSNANPKILDLYENEENILDIGCSTGMLAEKIRQINPIVKIDGVDISIDAKHEAEKHLDNFYLLNLDTDEFPNFGKKFDLIILGDVLEHIKHPDELLLKLENLLTKNGKIIISIPNVAYFRIRFRLLFGNFDYGDTGIMDRTHLRFFTQKTAKQLINSSGYKIEQEKFIFSKKLSSIKDTSKCKIINIFYRLFSVQFIFKIK